MTEVWRRQLKALALLWVVVLLLFHVDIIGMVAIWWTSTSYQHCFLIPPLIAWIVHQRAAALRELTPSAWTGGVFWLAAGSFIWLMGDAASLAVLRHFGVIMMLQGAVAGMLGAVVTRALLFPLFYAFFMVPVGSELEPALQLLTANLAMTMLGWVGVAAHIDGIFITTADGYFRVAEACSGARFVIAMTAYAALVCNVCFKSWTRRAVFFASALTLCVLANGVRAFAIIYIAHLNGIETARGIDHVAYGWIFFALVIIVTMAAAWPFFDRKANDPFLDIARLRVPSGKGRSLPAFMALALSPMAGALAWSALSSSHMAEPLPQPRLPYLGGWNQLVEHQQDWAPHFAGADHLVMGRYTDGQGHEVDIAIATYARQSEGHELIGFGQGAAWPNSRWSWTSPAPAPANANGERISAPGLGERIVFSFYRVGSSPVTGSAAKLKFAAMKARLTMGDQRAAAIVVSARDTQELPAQTVMTAFLNDLGSIDKVADAALHNR